MYNLNNNIVAKRNVKATVQRTDKSMKLVQFTRNSTKLSPGEYPFEGCVIDEWRFNDDDGNEVVLPFLAIDTENDGRQAILSGVLYNTHLTDDDDIVGNLIDTDINPIVDLAGSLHVTKNGDKVELELTGVTASQLAG